MSCQSNSNSKNKQNSNTNTRTSSASSSKQSQKNTCIPCEQMVYLATTLAVALAQDKTASEIELVSQFLTVTVSVLTSLAFCKAQNEGREFAIIPEEI